MRFESCSSPLIRSLARTLADRTSGRAAFQLLQDETWALRSACQEPDTGERVLNLPRDTPTMPRYAPLPRARRWYKPRLLEAEKAHGSATFGRRVPIPPTPSPICNRGN